VRVALINPPRPYLREEERTRPLGLMYLHSATRAACPWAWVDVCDLEGFHLDNVVPHLVAGTYDVYAWSATSRDYAVVLKLAQQIAGKVKGIHVLGGPHATVVDHHDFVFRAVFKGEGEVTFPRFLADLQRGEYETVYAGQRINRLEYLNFPYRGGAEQGPMLLGAENGSATVSTVRGCGYGCPSCAASALWPGVLRFRPPRSVAREVEILRDKGGIRDFVFWDENLTATTAYLRDVCAVLKPLRIHWRAAARSDVLGRAKLAMMHGAGCTDIDIDVVSFDNNVLTTLGKRTTGGMHVRMIELAAAEGMRARLHLMISTPGETCPETVDWNVAEVTRLEGKYGDVDCRIFMPWPGTGVAAHPEKFGVRLLGDEEIHEAADPWSPIEIVGVSRQDQMESIRRMQEFVQKVNRKEPQ
jgi:radical SAM superfamily enzyme YgiQ (UPF0313 family)